MPSPQGYPTGRTPVHQPLRALVATVVAAAALTIVVATTSSAATPVGAEPAPATPGAGAACAIDNPDCDDIGFVGDGDNEPGSSGSGVITAPPTTAPRAVVRTHRRRVTLRTERDSRDAAVPLRPATPAAASDRRPSLRDGER